MGHREDAARRGGFAAWIAALAGAAFLGVGTWAFAAPESFFRVVATFPPYNVHLLHDLGAFQIGTGAVLLLAAFVRDALVATLAGIGIGTLVHGAGHWIDWEIGGNPADPWILLGFAALLLAAAAWRGVRTIRR